jgi:exodeoxyribonuclease-3
MREQAMLMQRAWALRRGTVKLLSWNVNGIRAAYKKGLLDWFMKERPDVFCLQETKASEEDLPSDLTSVAGYDVIFSSADKKGYSGVALYSKVKPKKVYTSLGIPKFDVEGRLVAADLGDFIVFNVYFPNGKASSERLKFKMDFYAAFLKHVVALRKKGRGIVICGDVNTAHEEVDLARPKENEKISGFLPEERAWIDELISRGFVDTLRLFDDGPGRYTWWDLKTRARERNVGWRIDYFFVSEDLKRRVKNASIMSNVMGSDHCPISLELRNLSS